jgi:menaquinol-cytochrome c reductase iron-sulfur subunit
MHEPPDRTAPLADDRETLDRTRFLQRATILVGAVTAAIVAVPAATMAVAPGLHTGTYYDVDLGPVANFPADGAGPYHVVTFESFPHDTTGIGRRVAFVRNDGDGTFTALSYTCMHVGCPVRNFGTTFGCPCHGGQYDVEGRPTAGPPVRPLNRYVTRVDERGHLILGRLDAMDMQLRRHQLKPPGEPVTGIESILYPPAPQ